MSVATQTTTTCAFVLEPQVGNKRGPIEERKSRADIQGYIERGDACSLVRFLIECLPMALNKASEGESEIAQMLEKKPFKQIREPSKELSAQDLELLIQKIENCKFILPVGRHHLPRPQKRDIPLVCYSNSYVLMEGVALYRINEGFDDKIAICTGNSSSDISGSRSESPLSFRKIHAMSEHGRAEIESDSSPKPAKDATVCGSKSIGSDSAETPDANKRVINHREVEEFFSGLSEESLTKSRHVILISELFIKAMHYLKGQLQGQRGCDESPPQELVKGESAPFDITESRDNFYMRLTEENWWRFGCLV